MDRRAIMGSRLFKTGVRSPRSPTFWGSPGGEIRHYRASGEKLMNELELPADAQERAADLPPDEPVRAWEEIEPGRFMPRRVRGSFQGGKLG
jgi:hypothetical protein